MRKENYKLFFLWLWGRTEKGEILFRDKRGKDSGQLI